MYSTEKEFKIINSNFFLQSDIFTAKQQSICATEICTQPTASPRLPCLGPTAGVAATTEESRVFWQKFTDVSDVLATSIIRTTLP
jgi:hypothetical protein